MGRRDRIRCMGSSTIKDSTLNGRIIQVFLLEIKKAGQNEGDIGCLFVGIGLLDPVVWNGRMLLWSCHVFSVNHSLQNEMVIKRILLIVHNHG